MYLLHTSQVFTKRTAEYFFESGLPPTVFVLEGVTMDSIQILAIKVQFTSVVVDAILELN